MLGVVRALLALGAAVGRSRPAAFALVVVGVVVLVIALALDRPTLDDTRGLEAYYGDDGTEPQTGGGYTLELIAGAAGGCWRGRGAAAGAGCRLRRRRRDGGPLRTPRPRPTRLSERPRLRSALLRAEGGPARRFSVRCPDLGVV